MHSENIYKDHLVTQQEFQLHVTEPHHYLATYPIPDTSILSEYYDHPDYHSHNEDQNNFTSRVFHGIKTINTKYKIHIVKNNVTERNSILDYGCGTGYFLQNIKKKFENIQGIEPNPQAKQLAQKRSIPVVSARENTNGTPYSCITLWHVLEHIPDLDTTLQWLHSHLTEQGTLFIAVPNHASYDACYYKTHWAGWDVPRHLWHFTKPTLTSLLEEHHFRVIKFLPLPFDAFYVSLLSERYQNNSHPMLQAILRGFISNAYSLTTRQPSSFIAVVKKAI